MRIYELGFILKPDLSEQDAQAAIDAVKQTLTKGGANIDKIDDWASASSPTACEGSGTAITSSSSTPPRTAAP